MGVDFAAQEEVVAANEQQAKHVSETENRASNEVGEKTREEAESIITEAKANASGIIEAAYRQTADMWDNFKADLDKELKESEYNTKQLKQEARKKAEDIIESAHQESATIIAEARQRAEQATQADHRGGTRTKLRPYTN
jgi:vacuolar-type H+-ATPase subunit H